MPDHRPLEDWPLHRWEDPDPDPDPDDPDEADDDEFAETLPCPNCRAEIYEDVEQCPHCGEYITFAQSALAGWPWWFVALGAIGIAAVILSLLGMW